jgi:hypothetical protein
MNPAARMAVNPRVNAATIPLRGEPRMTAEIWLLGVAIATGVLSTLWPRSRWHWVAGTVSIAALVAAVLAVPSVTGAAWVVHTAEFASLVVNAVGLAMLLARRHPRRPHRHIIYCGYGVVFATVALAWAIAGEHVVAALVASAGAYVLGSVAIGLYKTRHTRGATRSSGQRGELGA